MRRALKCVAIALGLGVAMCMVAPPAAAEPAPAQQAVEWPFYGGDAGAQKYSPLDQINAANAANLQVAWIWRSPDSPSPGDSGGGESARADHFKATPIMVDGRLYVRNQFGTVEALDPATGATLWRHKPPFPATLTPKSYGFTTRGVAVWRGAPGAARIFSTTPDRRLIALDLATGQPVQTFGNGGAVNLDVGLRRIGDDPSFMNYGNQVPVVVGDVVVIGSVVTDSEISYLRQGQGERSNIPVGDIRGFDARTGALLWTFHTVPQAGEAGLETWENESWRWVGNTNAWSLMSADEALGHVYIPVSGPTFNYYGGFRKGDNLYGDSIVALDAKTGKKVWHFQAVRHPVFDYDMVAAPVVVDITVAGRAVKAVVGMNKTGFLYVLDRVTGQPVWPMEDRPVPQTTVPGERTAPTQPFPTKPPPVSPQGISADTVNNLTPELRAAALAVLAKHDHGPLFTPISIRGAILAPGISGGPNWPGGAFDPETGRIFVSAINEPTVRGLVPADNLYGYVFRRFSSRVHELPLSAPPWAMITAIDLNRGDLAWQVANGAGPKHHPRLAPLNLPDLGSPAKFSVMATKTLLFAASTGEGVFPDPAQPAPPAPAFGPGIDARLVAEMKFNSRAMFRAYDKATGRVVWQHPIGPSYNDAGGAMTYLWQGRQYVVTPVGGGGDASYLIAFALPRLDTSRHPSRRE